MKPYDTFICPVVEDSDGELCLEFPDEVLDALDFRIGDKLIWEPSLNGTWTIKKVNENGRSTD
jgi:uncharacterized membrane protein (UPF0127 family)